MNIYLIIFIIIIPICIFLLTLYNDNQFKIRLNELKSEFNNRLNVNNQQNLQTTSLYIK